MKTALLMCSALTMCGMATGAFAQSAPALAVDEVVVTANKRAENVQDVPKQVQVVGAEVLKQANVTSVTDLRKLIPSISGTGTSIRGVATSATTISANSKVGTVLDDIPIPSRATARSSATRRRRARASRRATAACSSTGSTTGGSSAASRRCGASPRGSPAGRSST